MEKVNQHEKPLIGGSIRRLREKRGMRNCDVVCFLNLEGLDVGSSTISKIETGHGNPTVSMLIALAKIFQCSFEEFFKEVED